MVLSTDVAGSLPKELMSGSPSRAITVDRGGSVPPSDPSSSYQNVHHGDEGGKPIKKKQCGKHASYTEFNTPLA